MSIFGALPGTFTAEPGFIAPEDTPKYFPMELRGALALREMPIPCELVAVPPPAFNGSIVVPPDKDTGFDAVEPPDLTIVTAASAPDAVENKNKNAKANL
jgi:hypothetical protein